MGERSEIRAGVFVVLALLILAAGTLWIVGTPMRGGRRDYEVQMRESGGVRRGDRVRVSGIEVGRVTSVELLAGEELPVMFNISIDGAVILREGSTARLTTDGLLGAPYLELHAGPAGASGLPSGSRILGVVGGDLDATLTGLGEATDRLPALLDQASSTLARIDAEIVPLLQSFQALLSEENVEAISAVMRKLEPMIEEVGTRLTALAGHLESLAMELEEGLGGVPELTNEVRGLVADLRHALGPEGGRLTGLLDSAQGTLSTADGALATLDGEEIEAMLHDLREAAANLRSLSQTLKERPGVLLRSNPPADRKPGEGVER